MFCEKKNDSLCAGERGLLKPFRTPACLPEGLKTQDTLGRIELIFVRSLVLPGWLFSDTSWAEGVSIAFDVIVNVKTESRPGRIISVFTIKKLAF